MARCGLVVLLLVAVAIHATAQDIKDNLAPKAGDVCRDLGDQWRNITLGPCEAGTECRNYKRGVFKCTYTDERGNMPLGTECYDELKVKADDKVWRQYYKVRSCEWRGVDKQGTARVQCIQDPSKPTYYACGVMPELGKQGCATVSGSMIWGRWNDNQRYDMCNGCPCTPPGKEGKYPTCRCDEPCTAERASLRCPTA